MNRRHVTLIAAAVALAVPLMLWAHGGGLDANGGHYDRRTGNYHYHRTPAASSPAPTPAPRAATPSVSRAPATPSVSRDASADAATIQYLRDMVTKHEREIMELTEKVQALDERLRGIEERGQPVEK